MNTVRWNNLKDALDDISTDVPQLSTKFHSAYQFATIAQDPIFYHNNIQAGTPALSSFLLKNGGSTNYDLAIDKGIRIIESFPG